MRSSGVCDCGSAAKLKCRPLALPVTGLLLLLKPSWMPASIAPVMAWPEACATVGVIMTCSARAFTLSAGTA